MTTFITVVGSTQATLLLIVSLLFAMALLYVLAQKVRVPYPIFLVLGGLAVSAIPGLPNVAVDPEIIFMVFLPPILFEAAWFTSWHQFVKWKRAIGFFAFGLVIATSCAVAVVSASLIPGFTLALGFLLGGIISPPDAVAATSILKEVKVPKRLSTILEGESLINDSSSLIVFRFALAAVGTGHFVLKEAVLDFFVVAIMGIVIGIAIAMIFHLLLKYLPTTASVGTVMSLIAPYTMYLLAEYFHFSGVLAVVSGGLLLSSKAHHFMDYESRIQASAFWNVWIFLLNGLVFILIGLQLRGVVAGLSGYTFFDAVYYSVIITILIIVIRIALVFPSAYVPRWFSKKIRDNEAHPPAKMVFLAGWAGMRGVVSLAAALAIPLTLPSGEAFPHRDLILFITFFVIMVTLVFQGLSMKLLVSWFDLEDLDQKITPERQLSKIRKRLARSSLEFLDREYSEDIQENAKLKRYYQQLQHVVNREEQILAEEEIEERRHARERFNEVFLSIVAMRREELQAIHRERLFDEEVLREYEHSLDLEEARMRV